MQYRRSNIKGGKYFFTVNLAERQPTLLVNEIYALRDVMKKLKENHPYHINAIHRYVADGTIPKD